MSVIDELKIEANALASDYFDTEAATLADVSLSDEGKRGRIDGAGKHYAMMLDLLRDKAHAYVAQDIDLAGREIGRARLASAKKQRELLGDGVYADVLRYRLELTDNAGIAAMLEDTVDDFTRAVVSGYGSALVASRIAADGPDIDSVELLMSLHAAEPTVDVEGPEADLAALQRFDVASLDLVAEAARLAALYGIDEATMRAQLIGNAPPDLPGDYESHDETDAGEMYRKFAERASDERKQQEAFDTVRQVAHVHGPAQDVPEHLRI
jgi:hypothetical protein